MFQSSDIYTAAELAEYAESIQNIRQAMSEQGRPLEEFTAEFETKHDITR